MEIPTQPPESKLIDDLRQAVRPKLSVRSAAAAAGISEGRWRQIIKGYNQISKDTVVPSIAPADTLARMARVVGATPEQLKAAGRDDAAEELVGLMSVRETVEYERGGGRIKAPAEDRKKLGAALASLIPREPARPVEPESHIPDFLTGAGLAWELVNELADSPEGDPDREWKGQRAVVATADVLTDALLRLNAGPAAKQLIQDMSYTAHVIMADQIEALHQEREGSDDAMETEAPAGTSPEGGSAEEGRPKPPPPPLSDPNAVPNLGPKERDQAAGEETGS